MKNLAVFVILISLFYSCKPAMNVKNSNKRSGIVRVKQFTDKKTTLMWAHYDPSQRQTLMYVDEDGKVKILTEQSPDAGVSNTLDLSAKANVTGKVDAETALKIQAELKKLTNRTTSLMVIRELLFRLSELGFNNSLTQTDLKTLFDKIINQSKDLITEEAKLEAAKSASEEEKKKNSSSTDTKAEPAMP